MTTKPCPLPSLTGPTQSSLDDLDPILSRRLPQAQGATAAAGPTLTPEERTQRMAGVFSTGLNVHLSGEEMQACR